MDQAADNQGCQSKEVATGCGTDTDLRLKPEACAREVSLPSISSGVGVRGYALQNMHRVTSVRRFALHFHLLHTLKLVSPGQEITLYHRDPIRGYHPPDVRTMREWLRLEAVSLLKSCMPRWKAGASGLEIVRQRVFPGMRIMDFVLKYFCEQSYVRLHPEVFCDLRHLCPAHADDVQG